MANLRSFRLVPRRLDSSVAVHVVSSRDVASFLEQRPTDERTWMKSLGFHGDAGQLVSVPSRAGTLSHFVYVPSEDGPFGYSALADRLPEGTFHLEGLDPRAANDAALGWALATYEFTRYKKSTRRRGELVWPEGADAVEVDRTARAVFMVRDLVNTPAEHMGPADLAKIARDIAKRHRAKVEVVTGPRLEAEYPLVHAVGRAAANPPCLVDLRWGEPNAPLVTLVGKGVCFDTGGLDLKGAADMLLMKKDMGGAAHVLALADAVMDAELPVRLRVLVPAVENAVAGNALRPKDVIKSRKGLTVEINNTDAEGRLLLADALADAATERPALLADFATLTGAARVALGTELPAMFADDDALADALARAGRECRDEVWRLPLHRPYRKQLESRVADLSNISMSSFGGAITAALFLREFSRGAARWAHFDLMAWNLEEKPGRPAGGEAMSLRAFYRFLSTDFRSLPELPSEPERRAPPARSETGRRSQKRDLPKQARKRR